MMYWLTVCLLCYVPVIPYCYWIIIKAFKTGEFNDLDRGIFAKEFVAKIMAWIPVFNIYSAYLLTHYCIRRWWTLRTVKDKLRKIAKKHQGTKAGDQLNDIINKIS